MNQPDWLVARPIAHRGLHDAMRAVENSVAAARAACGKNYAIECDVQLSADGAAIVFHDFTLERLTNASGALELKTARGLCAIALKGGADCIQTLPQFLAEIAGKTPLICEIKSRFSGDMRLAERAAQCAAAYNGPIALKSFDPALIAHLRQNRARLGIEKVPLGIVAQANFDDSADEWAHLSSHEKQALAHFLHYADTQPDFLSFGVNDLPHAVPFLCRAGLRMPVMAWTVRTRAQLDTARQWADQIIFEGDPAQC